MRIKIGTRGSVLALWQAHWVKDRLEAEVKGIKCEIVIIKTAGDRFTGMSLFQQPDKGFFTKDIEEDLLCKTIDIAVHSAKDLPTEIPGDLVIGAVPFREMSNDVLITGAGEKGVLKDLQSGAKIGTSSLRRKAQLLYLRRDFRIVDLRGNLDTRIKKLLEKELDGIIVAYAGVKRLDYEKRVSEIIEHEVMLPAAGQGALALEVRRDDSNIMEVVKTLNHKESMVSVNSERSFLKRLRAGCRAPVGAYSYIKEGTIKIAGMIAAVDGTCVVKKRMQGKSDDAERIGIKLAEELLKSGGAEILGGIEMRRV
ncbi:MAG: hydroxymethylbilane synthase [Spirochaetes bacterium]|nr:hydroxymethylbilane synthase [Spirochaetota bacterium]